MPHAANDNNFLLLKYKLPEFFHESIQSILETGGKLDFNQYSTFARDIARPISPITHAPDVNFIKAVVQMALDKYEKALSLENMIDKKATKVWEYITI